MLARLCQYTMVNETELRLANTTDGLTSIILGVNHSSLNGTVEESCSESEKLDPVFQIVLFSLIIIASLAGNSLIVVIVTRTKRMHSLSNILICNISLADLLITLLPMVWEVTRLAKYNDSTWPLGKFMCVFAHLCVYVSVAASALSLTVLSLDRFYLIVKPHDYKLKRKYHRYIVLVIWLLSFLFGAPTIFTQKVVRSEPDGKLNCIEKWGSPFDPEISAKVYTWVLFFFLYVIPLTLMTVLYSKLCINLWMRNNPNSETSERSKRSIARKRGVVIMLIILVLIFAIGWFPVFLAQFLIYFNPHYYSCPLDVPEALLFTGFFFEYLSSALNPVVYFTFSSSYRQGLAGLFSHSHRRRLEKKSPTLSRVHLSRHSPTSSRADIKMAASIEMLKKEENGNASPHLSVDRLLMLPTSHS